MTDKIIAPYGSWKSLVTSELIVADSVSIGDVVLHGDDIYWVEMRPADDARSVIVRRTPDALDSLPELDSTVRDPASDEPQQPAYARNPHRSIKPEILVLVGLCTHLGCAPSYVRKGEGNLGADWKGGFFCPCHGSRFDYAGRVYQGVPAPLNLEVPPHMYLSDSRIRIGEDEGTA